MMGSVIVIVITAPTQAPMLRSGRHFAVWLGLTPRQHSSGGKEKLSGISKQVDDYLRRLLAVRATAVIRMARRMQLGSNGQLRCLCAGRWR